MLLSLQNVSAGFGGIGGTELFSGVYAEVNDRDRIGIVGENGAGKTTLLRILTGELEPDAGIRAVAKNAAVGYLAQNTALNESNTVYEEAKTAFAAVIAALERVAEVEHQMAASAHAGLLEQHDRLLAFLAAKDAYQMDVNIQKVLAGLHFPKDTWEKPVAVLSGGERTRLAMAKLLLAAPDVLVLDEPTNHLDIDTMAWLEDFLTSYKGAVVAVSHDRAFLDKVPTQIWELAEKGIQLFRGNFSTYLSLKEAQVAFREKQYEAAMEKAKQLQEYIDRNLVRASTTKMAQSRRKTLEKMEIGPRPETEHLPLFFRFTYSTEPYDQVLAAKDLGIQIGGRWLLRHLELDLRRGQRLVIAGPNGSGKTTLLSVLSGKRLATEGRVFPGMGVRQGVFEQLHRGGGSPVLDGFWAKYPKLSQLEARSHLALYGFRGEDVFKPAAQLSGGEQARLRLAEMGMEDANLLFFDEPTNHLDIFARQVLTEALQSFTGSLVVVTHDRYLMEQLGAQILHIAPEGHRLFENFRGYMASLTGEPEKYAPPKTEVKTAAPGSAKELRQQRAQNRQRVKELESSIESLQADIQELENLCYEEKIYSDHQRFAEITEQLSDKRFELEQVFAQWEALVEESDE